MMCKTSLKKYRDPKVSDIPSFTIQKNLIQRKSSVYILILSKTLELGLIEVNKRNSILYQVWIRQDQLKVI